MPKPGLPINGYAIEDLRKERKMSQVELAGSARISKSYLNGIERGAKQVVGYDTIDRLAEVLGVQPGHLIAQVRKRVGSAADLEAVAS